MKNRHKEILNVLKEMNNYITGQEIANILNVTDRTIRNDIKEINALYDNIITSNKKLGYKLNNNLAYEDKIDTIPQSKFEREQYVLKKLLFASNNSVKIRQLVRELFISDHSLYKDINEINNLLANYHSLSVVQKNNYIVLLGDYKDKKLLLSNLIKSELKDNFTNISYMSKVFNNFDLIQLKNRFVHILNENNYQINESYIPVIMMHIGIAINFTNHTESDDETSIEAFAAGNEEEAIVYKFFQIIMQEMHVHIPYSEIKKISLLLESAKCLNQVKLFTISDEKIQALIYSICDSINQMFGVDLKNDDVFINSISLHLNSLINSGFKEKSLTNVYLKDIKNRFPLLFEMGISVKKLIDEYLLCDLSEAEIGFICLHIGVAYDRYIQNNNKLKTVLITPFGEIIAENCIKKINDSFETKLVIIDKFAYLDEMIVNSLNLDFIISTVPLRISGNIHIPIVEVSSFITSEDEYKIHKLLMDFQKKENTALINQLISKYIKKELFHTNIVAKSPEAVIKAMVDYLEKYDYVDHNYINGVLERENASSTSFNCGFAMPHSVYFDAKKTAISVCVLKDPILWGGYTVTTVIMLAVNEKDKIVFKSFIDFLGSIFNNSVSASKLLNSTTYNNFINNLLNSN